jgi:carboxypeptidase Q
MNAPRRSSLTAIMALLVIVPLAAQWPATEKPDLDAIYRIKDEGLQRSKVMEIESFLTDVYGPRLTGSPDIKEAADWNGGWRTSISKHGSLAAGGRTRKWSQ